MKIEMVPLKWEKNDYTDNYELRSKNGNQFIAEVGYSKQRKNYSIYITSRFPSLFGKKFTAPTLIDAENLIAEKLSKELNMWINIHPINFITNIENNFSK